MRDEYRAYLLIGLPGVAMGKHYAISFFLANILRVLPVGLADLSSLPTLVA
jgi:hypothetical protein